MLLIALFVTGGKPAMRVETFLPSLNDFPHMAFEPIEVIVKEPYFKFQVVQFLLNRFEQAIDRLHSIVVIHNEQVVKRWNAAGGHFKEIDVCPRS